MKVNWISKSNTKSYEPHNYSLNVPGGGPIRSTGYEAALESARSPRTLTGRKLEPLLQNKEPPIPAPWSVSGRGQNDMVKYAQLKKIGYSVVSVNGLRSGDDRNAAQFENVFRQVLHLILFDKPMDPKIAAKM